MRVFADVALIRRTAALYRAPSRCSAGVVGGIQMNEVVFYTTVFGLHGAAIVAAVIVALRALDQRTGRHFAI